MKRSDGLLTCMVVMTVIARLAGPGPGAFCWASNATIGSECGRSVRSVRRSVVWLSENGLLVVRYINCPRGTERRLYPAKGGGVEEEYVGTGRRGWLVGETFCPNARTMGEAVAEAELLRRIE